jgi:hypothetical protein
MSEKMMYKHGDKVHYLFKPFFHVFQGRIWCFQGRITFQFIQTLLTSTIKHFQDVGNFHANLSEKNKNIEDVTLDFKTSLTKELELLNLSEHLLF